jgi:hypothetical protein
MTQSGTPWGDGEVALLKQMAGSFPARHIADRIGRTTNGVLKKIKALGLKSYVNAPPKPHPVRPHRPVGEPKEQKAVEPKPKPPVALRKPLVVRESRVSNNVSYPPLEWCPTCHSPVSSWSDHTSRIGCKRPAA